MYSFDYGYLHFQKGNIITRKVTFFNACLVLLDLGFNLAEIQEILISIDTFINVCAKYLAGNSTSTEDYLDLNYT